MGRTELLQGLREMKFEEIHDRFRRGRLSAVEASEWLGVSERTFRRWRGRFDAEGSAGLLDRRLGKVSPARIAADEVDRIVSLYRNRYKEWNVRHFHERAVARHGLTASYGWTKSVLMLRARSGRRPTVGRTARSDRASRCPG